MQLHENFAVIVNDEVVNIISGLTYADAAFNIEERYEKGAFVVDCNRYPCGVGCKYNNGIFYRVNEKDELIEIPYIPTPEQEIQKMKADAGEVLEFNVDTAFKVSMLELQIK